MNMNDWMTAEHQARLEAEVDRLEAENKRLNVEAEEADEESESLALTIETLGHNVSVLEAEKALAVTQIGDLQRLVVKQFKMHQATIQQLAVALDEVELAEAGIGQSHAALLAASLGCTVAWLPDEGDDKG